ncbi:sortase [Cellulomonas sp. PhB150]|uniref:sortase n=1 Tax=Cellulomonas sp. PhB150 TaxID=2485188 RepID=UPI000FBCEB57|nr:sortase [Cellulomonas sp. PhB150]ROS21835.1 LPXTG-site transpeptidase (sortase) family protein [Cellulomonas sp. PhB150]
MTTMPQSLDAAIRPVAPSERARLVGTTLAIVAALALGIVVNALVVSPLRYERDQDVAGWAFRAQLANGTAPVGQVTTADRLLTPGTPVAIVTIPRLGVDDVVLEGTSSKVLLSGPGHRRDTVLPGQAGPVVVMGRHGAYGGVFAGLGTLRTGDVITTTTGQGTATYAVTGLRRTGDPLPDTLAPGAGRLTLVSADGPRWAPDDVLRVDAALVGEAFETPNAVLSSTLLADDEAAFAGDPDAWPLLLLALAALAGCAVLVAVLRRWWGRWQAWIVGVPLILLCGALVAEQTFVLLPNLV